MKKKKIVFTKKHAMEWLIAFRNRNAGKTKKEFRDGWRNNMANRRMFSKTITNSSRFLRMPPTSRLLYYDLGMNADDDGFVEWYSIVTMTKAAEQDLQLLEVNRFIKIFDDQVLVILDWKENNYLKADRYNPSKYLDKYPIVMDTNCIQVVSQVDTQVRLGKERIGKVSSGKKINKFPKVEDVTEKEIEEISRKYQVSTTIIKRTYEQMVIWSLKPENEKKVIGRNWKLTLMDWVLRDKPLEETVQRKRSKTVLGEV